MTDRNPRARTGLLAAGMLALFVAGGCPDQAAERAAAERDAALRAEVEKQRKDLEKLTDDVKRLRADVSQDGAEIGGLAERVKAVEERPAAAAAAAPQPGTAPAAPSAADRKARSDEMEALRKKVWDGTATDEEEDRFWELARTTGHIDEMLKTLEAAVKERPDDVEARMNLASGYISKLMMVPDGEKGRLSIKAEQQWKKVLEIDPDHWDSRFSMAFGWTFWPDQFNRTPDAIREFEKVREVQERRTPEAKHAQTYVQLSRLYLKQGKTDKARETLRAGLARHPGDAEITKSLESMQE